MEAQQAHDAVRSSNRFDLIDVTAQDVISRVLTGVVSEEEGRAWIADLALQADIHTVQVDSLARMLDRQQRRDLAEKVEAILLDRICHPAANGYRFDAADGASLCGWLRNYARTIIRSERFRVRDRAHREQLVDPTITSPHTDDEDGSHTMLTIDQAHQSTTTIDDSSVYSGLAATETIGRLCYVRDENKRIHLAARALAAAEGLPMPLRPYSTDDRDTICRILAGDPHAAWQSLADFNALVSGRMNDDRKRDADDRLLGLWDDYTADDRETLIGKDQKFAHLLAQAACANFPYPGKKNRAAMNRIIIAQNRKASGSGWNTKARQLFDAFLAREAEYVHGHDNLATPADVAKRRRRSTMMADQWPVLAASISPSPLGITDEEIVDALRRAFEAIEFDLPDEAAA